MKNKCLICGKDFETSNKNAKYCNYKCYWQSRKYCRGNKSPLWNKNLITKEELQYSYINKKMSVSNIARLKNTNPLCIIRRLKDWNIPKRTYYEQKKIDNELGRFKEIHKYRIVIGSEKRNRKTYLQIAKDNFDWRCMICGNDKTFGKYDLVVHHKDNNNKNNNIDNLMVLCQSCHSIHHSTGKVRKGLKNLKNR